MDVDNNDPVDQSLLQQFSCMGTSDKDDLVKQLQKLAGDNINATTASFFLDMNNWNLQAAVCSYFDFESPFKLPSMVLVRDETTETTNTLPPNTTFQKTWQVQNGGAEAWPAGCYLQLAGGDSLGGAARLPAPALPPGATAALSLQLTTPDRPGAVQSKWRMVTPSGAYFGDIIWLILTVTDEQTTNELSDQLQHLTALGAPPAREPPLTNPFAPPHLNNFQDSVPKMQDNDNTMC